jgi:hypothetical protein
MPGSGGQGQGWPRPAGVRLDGVFDGRGRFGNGFDANEMTYSVPAEKCGLVIGKGTHYFGLKSSLYFLLFLL